MLATSPAGGGRLQILLLGTVGASAEGRAIRLGGPKQRALLARLTLAEGRPVSSDQLAEDVWDHRPPADPVHAMQAHVSRLRALLSVRIDAVPGGYRLPTDGLDVDATRFARLCTLGVEQLAADDARAAAGTLTQALDLWRGPPFADLPGLTGLRPFAVRLEELRRTAQLDRIDAELLCDNGGAMLAELHALVEQHPLQERSWRQLMIALYREGRESEALAAYRRAREVFVDELGSEPGERLAQLHQAILARALPASAGLARRAERPPDPVPTVVALPEELSRRTQAGFTGREPELARLEAVWSSGGTGLRLVTLTGESGIGKTRLAAEFAARRAAEGTRVLFGGCDQFLGVAYQPFAEMMRSDLHGRTGEDLVDRAGPHAGELAHLLPDLTAEIPASETPIVPLDAGRAQHRIFDAVAGWLESTTAHSPAVLVLDDLQWADDNTLLALRHLVRTPRRIRALMVATFRDRESPLPADSAAVLDDLLRRSETTLHLPLRGLAEAAVADLLESDSTLDGAADHDRARLRRRVPDVMRASGGNPLFVLELARHAEDSPQGAVEAALSGDLPSGLVEAVDRRLRVLDPGVRTMLGWAAVMGSEFDTDVLARASGMDDVELEELLAAATYARLVVARDAGGLRYVFAHDVVRTIVYDGVPPSRRRERHRALGEALERSAARDDVRRTNELAHHFAAAAGGGTSSRAVEHLTRAGELALQQRSPSVAVAQLRRAQEALPHDASDLTRCDLMTARGTAELGAGDPAYRETLLAAARLALRVDDSARLSAAAVANNRGWWSSTATVDHERVTVIEAALERCDEDDEASRLQLLAAWAVENVRDPGQRDLSLRRSEQAMGIARRVGDDELLALALAHRYAVVYAAFANPAECVDLSEQLFDVARRRGDPSLRLSACTGLAQSTMMLGEFVVADRSLEQASQLSEALNQPARQWMVKCWQAMCLATRGRLEQAEAAATEAHELGTATRQPDAFTWFAGQLFTFRMLGGRLPELIEEIEAQVAAQAAGIPAWRAAYALALVEAGRPRDAGRILDEFLATSFARLPLDMLWLPGMHYLCGTAAALGRRDAAASLYRRLSPHAGLMAHNGTIDAGPVDLHLGVMARLLEDDEVGGAHLSAALDLCRHVDAPLWQARVESYL